MNYVYARRWLAADIQQFLLEYIVLCVSSRVLDFLNCSCGDVG